MPRLVERVVFDLSQVDETASEMLAQAGNVRIWLLQGEMGSGKTTFTKALGRALGVTETMSSPTFSIVNEYQSASGKTIYHFDLYRLRDLREVLDIGIEEYLDSGHYCFLEWPDLVKDLVEGRFIELTFRNLGETTRQIDYVTYE